MNILNKLSLFAKKALCSKKFWAISLVASFILTTIQFMGVNAAQDPVFNAFTGEQDFLKAGWQGEAGTVDFTDPVSLPNAKEGDLVKFRVYFHNAVVDTIALNTNVRVNLPQGFSDQIIPAGYIQADNAAQVGDNVLIKDLSNKFKLEYVPGSTKKWTLSNPAEPDNFDSVKEMPDGVVSPQGLNIGNIYGCWDYRGFITFQTKLVKEVTPPVTNPQLALAKTVDKTDVSKLEDVNYTLVVSNPGDATATNVVLHDTLPTQIEFVSGIDNDIFGKGINIGSLNAGQSESFTFKAKVTDLSPGHYTFTNWAKAIADNNLEAEANVAVNVFVPGVPVPPVTHPALALTKTVDKPNANKLDEVNFTLTVSNPGDATATNVILRDTLPRQIEFVSGIDKDLFGKGINIGDLTAGQSKSFTFKAKVIDLSPGQYSFTNWSYAKADNDLEANAQAVVNIHVPSVPVVKEAKLEMDKFVRNVTKGDIEFVKEDQAFAGDILEYKVWFKNVGNSVMDNVEVFDTIPANTSYIPNSAFVVISGNKTAIANPVGNWVNVGSLQPDQSGYVLIQVQTDKNLTVGTSLVNTGFVRAEGIDSREAQAKTTIKDKTVIVPEQPVTPETPIIKGVQLPKTGANTLALSGLMFIISGIGYFYFRSKAALAAAELGQF